MPTSTVGAPKFKTSVLQLGVDGLLTGLYGDRIPIVHMLGTSQLRIGYQMNGGYQVFDTG